MTAKTAGHGSKFTRKMEEAIHALCTKRTIEEAAKSIGVGKQTLIRWLKRPDFRAAYLEARRQAVSQANARLQQAASAAAATLVNLTLDPATPAAARVRAADCILDRAQRAIEFEDITVRLDALERANPPGK